MLISLTTSEIVTEIFYKRGLKNKEETILLYTIIIPSQIISYDVSNNKFIEEPVKVKVKHHIENDYKWNEGTWPLNTFTKFVESVKIVTETAKPYIKSNLDFIAQAKISETTYVWSKFLEEKVAGGMFKETKYEDIQNISFDILGLQSDYVRWSDDMLNPMIELRDNFNLQMDDFKNRINMVNQSD